MKVKFNVRHKSVQTFLEERILGYKKDENSRSVHGDIVNYNLLKDEILFKKNCGIECGESVIIELFDRASNSNRELTNTYTYLAEEYDDVAIKLTLKDFKVSATGQWQK